MFALMLFVHLTLTGPASAGVQAQANVLDRIVATVNSEVVTQSDVRAARQLKLIAGADAMTDDQLLDALIERRLTIKKRALQTAAPGGPARASKSAPGGACSKRARDGRHARPRSEWFHDLRLAASLVSSPQPQPTRQRRPHVPGSRPTSPWRRRPVAQSNPKSAGG